MEASKIEKLYEAVFRREWKTLEELSNETDSNRNMLLLSPVSMHKDNIIHLAVQSLEKEPLENILEFVKSDMLPTLTSSVNAFGNTVLHEAANCGNFEAVKLLVDKNNELLEMKNDSGETPLFRAAHAFGSTKIVKFLAAQRGQTVIDSNGKVQLKRIHRNNNDGDSILLAAIQALNFETALALLKLDETLGELEDKSVSIGYPLYDRVKHMNKEEDPDIEKGLRQGLPTGSACHEAEAKNGERPIYKRLYKIYVSFWDMLRGWSVVRELWVEKREYVLACELARKLIEKDKSWDQREMQFSYGDRPPGEVENEGEEKSRNPLFSAIRTGNEKMQFSRPPGEVENEGEEKSRNPLFSAIRTGNEEIVKLILDQHPLAFECINHKKQNILHMAVMYRQKEIFNFMKERYKIMLRRLAQQIDSNGYTIIHSVADTTYYKGRKRTGPAYQLQEELEWFYDVGGITPPYYWKLPDKNNKTSWEVFVECHDEQHKEAQSWMRATSQLCASLAISAVFAAAFNVAAGTSENDHTIPLKSPFFPFFTVTVVVSLSSSFTAIAMFAAILISPLELQTFRTLPNRLTMAFALLFVSVAASMLAYTSTIFHIFHLGQRQRWPLTLVCSAAFLPLSVFALTQFPLIDSFMKVCSFLFFPSKLVRRFWRITRT